MIDLSKITYQVFVVDEHSIWYNITDVITDLGWEENENEISVRSSFTVKNSDVSKEKVSSLIKPGCQVIICASDGNSFDEEVARGYVTTWNPVVQNRSDSLKCTNYDLLYSLQKSQDNRYYPSGTGTQSIVTELFKDYGIPMQEYHGPNVTHGKLKYNNSYVSDIIFDVLDDVKKKGGGTYFLRAAKGYVDFMEKGSNSMVYVFQAENTQSISSQISVADLITRVKVIGKENSKGYSSVEATLNGLLQYGIRQRIYTRGSDESLADAKSAAQQILDENGTIKEKVTLQAPDVPFLRKGDFVFVTIGVSENNYFIKGIRHDCSHATMTMELELADLQTVTAENKTEIKKEYQEGDVVNFHGGMHYVSSYPGAKGYSARAGKAKITKKNGSGKAHPWHLIHTDSESNVYGWVDDGTFD